MELIYDMVAETIKTAVENMNIDYTDIMSLKSMQALEKIKAVIENDSLSDFECIERIVKIFEQIGSNAGNRHDF